MAEVVAIPVAEIADKLVKIDHPRRQRQARKANG
jgi:hypothetical protein